MAFIRSVSNALGNIAFAQNVTLEIDSSNVQLMRNVEFGWTRPETRYAHGLTRTYGHGPPDAELTFTISANAGAYAYLMAKSDDLDQDTPHGKPARGVLGNSTWKVKIEGDGGNSETVSFEGKLRDITVRKPDGDNSEVVDIDCVVRITSDTVTVT